MAGAAEEERDGSSFPRRSVLGVCLTVQLSTCIAPSQTSCLVENITSPANFILLNGLLAQSKENQCNRAWLPAQQEMLPGTPDTPRCPKGSQLVPPERGGGGVSCRSSSSVRAVAKKVA